MSEKLPDDGVRCQECGETCGFAKGCRLYAPVDEPHGHCPGGNTDYVLCAPCEKKCLAIHRPVAADGSWKWIKDCGDKTCGYCKTLATFAKKYGFCR